MKFLLAGDSDVGKAEILQHLQADYDAPTNDAVASTSQTVNHQSSSSDHHIHHHRHHQTSSYYSIHSPGGAYNDRIPAPHPYHHYQQEQDQQQFNFHQSATSNSAHNFNVAYKSTNVLLDGKRIRVQLWDTSGQGRFSTIIRSYSRGAQGILLVYDITRKWSFNGLDRWIKEIDEHAPGIPKILIGNRLHLEFNRQVDHATAEHYAKKHRMPFFEVSHLCDYTIREALVELSRMVLLRNGIDQIWKNQVLSLQDLCCRTIVASTQSVDHLKLPAQLRQYLKSYSHSSLMRRFHHSSNHAYKSDSETKKPRNKLRRLLKWVARAKEYV